MKKIHRILLFCTTLVLIAGVWVGAWLYSTSPDDTLTILNQHGTAATSSVSFYSSHDAYFSATLEALAGCTDSSAIEAIYVERRTGYNDAQVGRTKIIRNRIRIGSIYRRLMDGQYDCLNEEFCPTGSNPTSLYREMGSRGGCGYYTLITLEFTNKTALRFWYFPDIDHLFFSVDLHYLNWIQVNLFPHYTNNTLRFTPMELRSLRRLLRITD